MTAIVLTNFEQVVCGFIVTMCALGLIADHRRNTPRRPRGGAR